MLVFDSNIWIFQFTGTNVRATRLLDEAIVKNHPIAIDAYILKEVLLGIRSSAKLIGGERDEAQQDFLNLVESTPNILTRYTTAERYDISLDEIRTTPCNKTLSMVLDIQMNDAPVVSFACEFYNQSPTIYTNDTDFSCMSPNNCGLSNLTVEYIPNESEDEPMPTL